MATRALSTFTVSNYAARPLDSGVTTAAEVSGATMDKTYSGALEGTSVTQFIGALGADGTAGTYLALESVAGTLEGRSGTFNLAHSSTMVNGAVTHTFLVVVPASGTGELAGISGTGAIEIDPDGTHRLILDYALA